MSKYEEKMKALEVLKEACNKVTDAMNAIEDFAEEYGINVSFEKGPKEVTVEDLGEMVAEELHLKPSCAVAAVTCAFDLIRELELTVLTGEEDDDE